MKIQMLLIVIMLAVFTARNEAQDVLSVPATPMEGVELALTEFDQQESFKNPFRLWIHQVGQKGLAYEAFQSTDPFNEIRTIPRSSLGADGNVVRVGSGMGGGMSGMSTGKEYPNEEDQFRQSLMDATSELMSVTDDEKKSLLNGAIRHAFRIRFEKQMEEKEVVLKEMETKIIALRTEFNRRKEGKDRVVDLQMQSVNLYLDGIIEFDDLPLGKKVPLSAEPSETREPGGGGMM